MAEIVGILAGFVAPAIELGKCFKKQFKYLCCLKTNIKDLTDAAAKMEGKRVDLQNRVDTVKRNDEVISREVETWLTKAEETQRTAKQIIEAEIPARILSLKPRYSLSRKAIKKTESIKELLRESSNFNPLSTTRTLDQPALSKGTMIDSRKETEEDIIMAIKDAGVSVIGLWGMGGVGKTTMADRIMARAREEGLFDEFPFVTVSQKANMLRIQRGIADWLGLELNQEALGPRASRLRARLSDAKRKLIVIDDVWESIDLESLGIPVCGKTGSSCKVLLTSRIDKGVLDLMNAQRIFRVDTLSEGEAWFMFKENAGTCVDDPNLLPKTREVARECKGLPLALVVVGKTLKDEKNMRVWSDALMQLRSSNPIGMSSVIKGVYNPIKLSIDFLDSPQAKSLLFLCSSFPEDYDIWVEELVFYSFGLCMLGNNINNLEGARNRIAMLIKTLKSRSLILDGKNEDYVKMHDVVRDVVIFIASKEKQAIVEIKSSNEWSRKNPHSTMLSVVVAKEKNIELLPMELGATFPNLRFLWMEKQGLGGLPSMSVNFLKGMQQLKVLHISSFSFGSMQFPKNLHTLHLEHCYNLETLSPVGELSSLEILICIRCLGIKELPVEIGRLNRLRILDVSDCHNLKTIKSGIISRLDQLEELKLLNSFKGWESVEEGSNVSLVEIESLSNLRCLEIGIEDWSLATQELQFLSSSNIVKYDIRVGVGKSSSFEWKITPNYEKKLSLVFPKVETLSIGKWIDVFARSADYLHLEGDDYNTFDFALGCYTQNKKHLYLIDCPTVEKLGVFPMLEWLHLESLPNLVEIIISYGSNNNSFAKLTGIYISGCGKLRSPFRSSLEVITSLSQQLERLRIYDCESMEEVFSIELLQEDIVSPITFTFPKLEYMSLGSLPSLTTLCKGIIHDDIINMNIEFPRLLELNIQNCPKLMVSFSNIDSDQNQLLNCSSSSSSSTAHIQDSIHLLCHEKVTFGNLKTLWIIGYENMSYVWCHHIPQPFFGALEQLDISYCANINNLFSYSIAANLGNLKKLTIDECSEMVYVIADDKAETKPLTLIFHKLEWVSLYSLPKLASFCEGRWDLQFPSLREVEIDNCSDMKGFSLGSISTPNLKNFKVDGQEKSVEDFIKHPWQQLSSLKPDSSEYI